jgi:GMP synthase-like glutamine amidotransferase
MKIGVLHCGHVPEVIADTHGDFRAMFARLLDGHGFSLASYDVCDMEFPAGPELADGWLITGSLHGAYEDVPFIAPLEDLIRSIHVAKRPMVGICFGHQIIAQALGGRVEKFDGGWSVGRTEYRFDGHGDLALNAWHQDQVVERPEGARVVASSDFCENAALAYGDSILTVQPHPELDPFILGDFLRAKRDTVPVPADMMDAAEAALDQPTDEPVLARMIAGHFRGA